jgi:hypothetical protein
VTNLSLEDAAAPRNELSVLVGGKPGVSGAPEELLLIGRPDASGRVSVRSWTSNDWGATPVERERSASEVLEELERAVRHGRSLNHELLVVRRWLGGERIASEGH